VVKGTTVKLTNSKEKKTMDLRAKIFVIVLSLTMLAFVINLVRRKYLKENYAIFWVVTCLVIGILPLLINYLDKIANTVGIYYPPAFLYLIATILIFLLILHFSVIVSKLSEQNKSLIQDVGILTKRINEIEATSLSGKTNSILEKEVEA
jgi:hypothetical protein